MTQAAAMDAATRFAAMSGEAATLTLTDFLLARIKTDLADAWAQSGLSATAFAETRAFRECEAKRRIVGLHQHQTPYPDRCDTLRALAAVYADDSDYRDEWRP